MNVVLRTDGDPTRLASAVQTEVRRLDPSLPVANLRPLEEVVYDSLAQPRFITFLVLAFAVVALALAAIGIDAVLASMVEQRTQEIGVLLALGAQARQMLRMILGQGAWLVGTGLVLGGGSSPPSSRCSRLWPSSPAGCRRDGRWRWIRWWRCGASRGVGDIALGRR